MKSNKVLIKKTEEIEFRSVGVIIDIYQDAVNNEQRVVVAFELENVIVTADTSASKFIWKPELREQIIVEGVAIEGRKQLRFQKAKPVKIDENLKELILML